MYKIVRPEKDATVYKYEPDLNAGIDEVLELNTRRTRDVATDEETVSDTPEPSRILMKFPALNEEFETISQDGPNVFAQRGFQTVDRSSQSAPTSTFGLGPPNVFAFFGESKAPQRTDEGPESEPEELETYKSSAWLRMWFASGMGMPKRYVVKAHPVENYWREGRGRLENVPATEEAVTWNSRTSDEDWNQPGGDFDSSNYVQEIFDNDDPDINLRMNGVLSENPENGVLLKREDEDFDRQTELKFFSKDTRTIYVPHLLVGKDTYEFNTNGAEPVDFENFTAFVTNLKDEYHETKARFNVKVEKRYEERGFLGIRPTARTDSIGSEKYLPRRSLTYEIRDVRTGVKFFPFDKRFTAISFDGDKHYFEVDFTNLLPKRKYEIVFRYEDPKTGNTTIFENEQRFVIEP